jgi:hypothetical protein
MLADLGLLDDEQGLGVFRAIGGHVAKRMPAVVTFLERPAIGDNLSRLVVGRVSHR